MNDELKALVAEIGRQSHDARVGRHGLPEPFDADLWQVLETSGLTRLTSEQGADAAEAAVVLGELARWAGAVPVAETDVLATWLAAQADLTVPAEGPLTVAITDVERATAGWSAPPATCRGLPWDPWCWPPAPPRPPSSRCSRRVRSTARRIWVASRAAR